MERTLFGAWRGVLTGRRLEKDRLRMSSYIHRIQEMAVEMLGFRIENEQLLEV